MKRICRLPIAIISVLALLFLSACAAQYGGGANFAPMPASAPTSSAGNHDFREMHGLSDPWITSVFRGRADSFESDMAYFDFNITSPNAPDEVPRTPRRIKTGSMSMESTDVGQATALFEQITREFGGWIENRSMDSGVRQSANLTLRVPAALYEDFVLAVSEIGRVRSSNDNVIDVTHEYFDAQTRLNINRAEESRLLEFIENSTNLEDIILLEARLSDVRMEIELHEGSIRRIDRAVSYSTLHVHIMERGAPTIRPVAANLSTRMGDGFTSSASGVVSFLGNVAVVITYLSVPLVIGGICTAVGMTVHKKRKKRLQGAS